MKYINLIITSLILLASCEKTINIDIEDKGRKIVVNSIFASDELIGVQLLESKYIMDASYEYLPVKNASITLLENQTEIETVSQNESGEYHFSSPLTPGNRYGVIVNSASYGTANAQSYLPEKSKIDKIEYQLKYTGENEYQYIEKAKLKLEFTDAASTENFYEIRVYTKYEEPVTDPSTNEVIGSKYAKNFIPISSEDPSVYGGLYETPGIFLNDELFDGQQHTISFETDYFEYSNDTQTIYFIELNSLSRDLYNYYRSYSQYTETKDNPFAEPVKVYNNIENGFGIFGGYTITVDSVEIEVPYKK